MNSVIAWGLIFASAVVCAQPTEDAPRTPKVRNKAMTQEQLKATIRRIQEKKTGGQIRKAGSARGAFAIVNAQTRVLASEIVGVTTSIDHWIRIQTVTADTTEQICATNAKNAIERAGGTVGVCLIEDPELPGFLVAPEDGWALVNVSRFVPASTDEATLASRIRKEILRSVSFVLGGVYSAKADPLMRDIKHPSDLDRSDVESYGIETITTLRESAKFYGVTPWYQTTYRTACEEGWAPAPTNEAQRAIWEKVHAVPAKPMRIEFDPKRGR